MLHDSDSDKPEKFLVPLYSILHLESHDNSTLQYESTRRVRCEEKTSSKEWEIAVDGHRLQ